MKSNHTTHEFDFHFTHRVELDFSPLLRSFVMGLFEDISAKLDEAKQVSIDEHNEVMAAIDALKGGVSTDPSLSLSPDQRNQLLAKIDDLKTTIQDVHDASVTGTGTPTTPTTPPTGPTDVTGTTAPTPTGPAPAGPTPAPVPGP